MSSQPIGPILQSFFHDCLITMKGLRPSSLRSYRDGIKLFVGFVANDAHRRITQLTLADLTFERALNFVRHLEEVRHNHPWTRNQRLALLHTFFEYLAVRDPEMVAVAERVAAIPPKRVPPPETHFLERDEITALFTKLRPSGQHAARDRALILFLYNTGARVQEAVDLRAGDLDLAPTARVAFTGKATSGGRALCGRTPRSNSRHCSGRDCIRRIELSLPLARESRSLASESTRIVRIRGNAG